MDIREAGRTLGKLGGQKGGHARAAKLSPKRRREIARAAANARWQNKKLNWPTYARLVSWRKQKEYLEKHLIELQRKRRALKKMIDAGHVLIDAALEKQKKG